MIIISDSGQLFGLIDYTWFGFGIVFHIRFGFWVYKDGFGLALNFLLYLYRQTFPSVYTGHCKLSPSLPLSFCLCLFYHPKVL